MNLQGEFESSFLTSILQLLCDDQNTGILHVSCGRKECQVMFKEGTIVYAQSSQKRARLGSLLRRDDLISAEQLKDAVHARENTNDSIGKILLNKGYITWDVLQEYSQKQVEEILYSILFWKKGKFEYTDSQVKLDGKIITRLNPMKLILEASRRIDEMSLLTAMITSDELVYKMAGSKKKDALEFIFSSTERHILSLIDATRTVRDIINQSSYDEFTVYKTLYSLISSGLIENSRGENAATDGPGFNFILSIYTDILKIITRTLAVHSGQRINLLIRKAQENLPRTQAKVLQDFHLSSAAAVNREAVTASCRKAGGDGVRQCLLLIDSFNGLCHLLLSQTIPLVAHHEVYDIIQEIDKVLEYVQRYPKNSVEKDKIISDMKNVLNDTIKQVRFVPGKTKNMGFLALFKKK
jgi:predicted transcriptional regulator